MISINDVVAFLIEKGPGRSQAELAEASFGSSGYQQRVREECHMLLNAGDVERRGSGVAGDPYRYFPARNGK